MDKVTKLHWSSASRTHVGMVRKLNEDSCLELTDRGLWVVADGMGGHAAGDVASKMVVDTLSRVAAPASLDDFVTDVKQRLQRVNDELRKEAVQRQARVIGSTVVALLEVDNSCVAIWAGDSRAYVYRDNKLRKLTRDHSQVEDLVRQGLITSEQAENHPASNVITRAVGVTDDLDLDSEIFDARDGDVFLLCSDGLYNEVGIKEIEKFLSIGDCHVSAERLVQKALDNGARDNVTVVVIRVDDDSQITKTVLNPSAFKTNNHDEDEDQTTVNRQ